MFFGLGEEERIRFWKKKKNLIAAKMVRIEGILKHIPSEIFFAVLEPFLNETAFYAKRLGGF